MYMRKISFTIYYYCKMPQLHKTLRRQSLPCIMLLFWHDPCLAGAGRLLPSGLVSLAVLHISYCTYSWETYEIQTRTFTDKSIKYNHCKLVHYVQFINFYTRYICCLRVFSSRDVTKNVSLLRTYSL